jgi:hypothetical protein
MRVSVFEYVRLRVCVCFVCVYVYICEYVCKCVRVCANVNTCVCEITVASDRRLQRQKW